MLRSFFLALAVFLSGCGGGGGSSSAVREVVLANQPPTTAEIRAAGRLASQATFGLIYDDIVLLAKDGHETWLDEQFALPATLHKPVVTQLMETLSQNGLPSTMTEVEHKVRFRRYAWWNRTMTAPDVLRQRVAYALSQIFVVSDNVDVLNENPLALSTYYDVLLTHAFGNYRDLLEGVALHPAMGVYLSHVNNAKSNPAANTFPDENFAREVMQLFSIGLFELNEDGTERTDSGGRLIPTYNNTTIRQMAKIFTGLSYGPPNQAFGARQPVLDVPMQMFNAQHEGGDKQLLNGVVVPAGQTGMQDFQMAIDNLFEHPNVGPFIGKQLIQRLVTSNPSPGYVARVSAVFNGDNSGTRGDMQAVLRAILNDNEATAPSNQINSGRLREPIMRIISMARQLNAGTSDSSFYSDGYAQQAILRQHPLSAPSVFNFYSPNHSPAGSLTQAGLVAPEFQITDATTIVGITNLTDAGAVGSFILDVKEPFGDVAVDITEFIELVETEGIEPLLDRLDLLFTHGELSTDSREVISGVLEDIDASELRARTALYLFLISPEYAVDI